MSISQAEEDPLKKQFQTLEEDWKSYKSSIPRGHRRALSTTTNGLTSGDNNDIFILFNNSPKKLLSSLQRHDTDLITRSSTTDLPRKTEGRRSLLEAFESVKDGSSACSSVLIDREFSDEGEHSSSCTCCLKRECSTNLVVSHDSSSGCDSLDCRLGEPVKGRRGKERWIMRMIWGFVAVWVVVVGVSLAVEEFGREKIRYGEYMIPT